MSLKILKNLQFHEIVLEVNSFKKIYMNLFTRTIEKYLPKIIYFKKVLDEESTFLYYADNILPKKCTLFTLF